jgi:hypothetical protein
MAGNNSMHRYQSVGADERDEIDDLELHVEEVIDLDEKDYMHTAPPRSRRTRVLELLNRCRWIIDGFLVALIIVLLVDRQWDGQTKEKDAQFEGAGDVTGFAPQCTWIAQRKFKRSLEADLLQSLRRL